MSKKAKIIIGVIVIVLLGAGIGVWYWYKISAEFIIGCQSSSAITAFMGRPGDNLVDYDFFGNSIKVNQVIAPFLDNVKKDITAANTGYTFDNVTTFNNRSKRGGGGKSLHSWAIAIDINPDRNPYQIGNYGPAVNDFPVAVIDAFRKNGFQWGGDWPGERDAMHFEWYGGEVIGSILDAQSGQKVVDVATFVDGAGSPNANSDFTWVLTAGKHKITTQARGYADLSQDVDVFCFQVQRMDITLTALPENTPGQISGHVIVSGDTPLLIPATIYLDGKAVGTSNIRGDYQISNVRRGVHQVEAKILLFPGSKVATPDMKPGENLKNLDILIGR